MKKTFLIWGVVFLAVAGVYWGYRNWEAPSENVPGNDPRNATYDVDGLSVTLTDGFSEIEAAPDSASKITTRYFGNEAKGDLNGDGEEDVAFFLTQNGGGTGTFYYAAAAMKTATGYAGTNTVLLGDRIAPQTIEIRNGMLAVNYADRGPDEPLAEAPSMGKSKYLVVQENRLLETPIFIEEPQLGETVSSPLRVSGVAQGPWFFEASFPLILVDEEGGVVAEHFATAEGEWMTTDYVRFSGTLEFDEPRTSHGLLIFKKDNPSDLPENDAWVSLPIFFGEEQSSLPPEENVFCTQEAKLCPDGSSVGRTGPNCEFAPCPSP